MPGAFPANPLIFHITHVGNLTSIIAHGCLWSDAQRIAKNLVTTNIGYSHIKQRRLNRPVTTGAGGKLGDYVPFNLCPRSVMLYAVSRGHQDYAGGQDEIVHLVSSVNTATALGKPWAFTDLHADLAYASYFSSLTQLDQVDWNVMPLMHWGGNDDAKAKRQAEFLVHDSFPWSAIECIGVKSSAVAAKVQTLLPHGRPPVVVQPNWYY
jgi:ssDNA thymidine ADP-ribosyltransferase, DarT